MNAPRDLSLHGAPDGTGPAPLAVVLKGYPRLSETFIAQELLALQERGHRFAIWSLRHPYDGGRTHPIHDRITAPCHYLPEYLHRHPLRLLRAWRIARRLPGYGAAWSAWRRDLARDRTRNRVRRWGQALVLAAELPAETRLLYAHFLHTPASVTRYAAIMRGLAWGVSAHAKDIWTIPDWEKTEKLAEARFAVTCTGTGAAELRRLAPDPDRVGLVYHGLDLSRFPAPVTRPSKTDKIRILSVGRLVEKKGYDDLIRGLAEITDMLDWEFHHIGGGELGNSLKHLAYENGIEALVTFHGKQNQTQVVQAMRDADIFVLPSKIASDGDRDGLPNVLMEAASQKLPILSTNVSAIPEFIASGVHGHLIPSSAPEELARAIEEMAADPDGRARMAEAAYQRLIADFTMDAGIDLLEDRLSRALIAG
ncbi:MAG: glycosyltransferase family 4 protein [Pseudomonadota bacterium]